ncbi:MAG: VWA domain-containing protein [Rhizobiaceae bacterium]|nr:VWA domain-containing protein [Rhizobiaceae bacterium]
MNPLRSAAKSFLASRSGNFAVLAAAVSAALVLAGGLALNIGQMSMTRSNLLNALDAAVTSTARDITTGRLAAKDARATVEAFLLSNGGTGFASEDRIRLVDLVTNPKTRTLRANASVTIDLAFPVFAGGSKRTINVESAAVYSDRKIEVAMMLDVTGSMAGRKLRDLKEAARNAIETLLASNSKTNPRVRVALVPYATAVNTGPLANTVFVEPSFTVGEPPRLDAPKLIGSRRFDDCATERKGLLQFTDASPYDAMVNRDIRLNYCPSNALTPLTANENALRASIKNFRAAGYTAGHIGIQWSWYVLSPNWASVMPAAARPIGYDSKKVGKYAILMTDGEFNTAYAGVGRRGTTDGSQVRRSGNYAKRLCKEMKAAGIEIFTIGFMLNERNAKDVMRDCASDDKGRVRHYFDTSNGAELNAAFQEIAANIERLALTR